MIAATLTGPVNLASPDPATISLTAMAHGLAKIDRWAGALEVPWSVAQHSLLVEQIFIRLEPSLRPWSLWALKHDAHEYVIGDVYGPTERLLASRVDAFAPALAMLKLQLDATIEMAFDLPTAIPTFVGDADLLAAIAEADRLAAGIEWRDFMSAANGKNPFPLPRFSLPRQKVLSWPDAAEAFATRMTQLLDERPWTR